MENKMLRSMCRKTRTDGACNQDMRGSQSMIEKSVETLFAEVSFCSDNRMESTRHMCDAAA